MWLTPVILLRQQVMTPRPKHQQQCGMGFGNEKLRVNPIPNLNPNPIACLYVMSTTHVLR